MSFNKRWTQHKYELKNNQHPNQYLQDDWNKYGSENFDVVVLEECSGKDIDECEIRWMEIYKSLDRDYGYNLASGGNFGKLAEETKLKLSNAKLGVKFSEEHKEKLRENHHKLRGETSPTFCKKSGKCTSKYLGVGFRKDRNKWQSFIRINGKVIRLGTFKDEIEAAKRWDEACWDLYHRLDILNFPENYLSKE